MYIYIYTSGAVKKTFENFNVDSTKPKIDEG